MSGALSSISAIAGQASSVISAVSQLFGGSGGVQLGSVSFSDIEVPEKISWGGKQDIVKQKLPGGQVVLNSMGIEFPPITWSGIFDGASALERSREPYTMMNASAIVALSWNDRSYKVLVSEYVAEDTKTNWIPYKVTCIVLSDETLSQTSASTSLLSTVTSDIASAIGVTPAQLTSTVGTALKVAQTASTVVGAVTSGSSAFLGLSTAIGAVTGVVGGSITTANAGISSLTSAAQSAGSSILAAGSALSGVTGMASALSNASNLAALPIVGGLVGRVTSNLRNAST